MTRKRPMAHEKAVRAGLVIPKEAIEAAHTIMNATGSFYGGAPSYEATLIARALLDALAEIERLKAEIRTLRNYGVNAEAREAKLREALEFYARMGRDDGYVAHMALKEGGSRPYTAA